MIRSQFTPAFGSLFTGIGGFDLGFERAGMRCAWQCEIDRAARGVLYGKFPGIPLYEDVRKVTARSSEPVDVLCGGFPCQDLSVAGKRAGLAGERSGLWHEFARITAEHRPRVVVIENVPGLLSSHGGRDFATLLRGLAELGYLVASRVLDSQYDRVAQRRRRVFIVGSLGDGRAAEILFEPESLRRDSAPGREAAEDVAGTVTSGFGRRRGGGTEPELCVAGTLGGGGRVRGGFSTDDIPLARCVTARERNRQDAETTAMVVAPLTTRSYADNDGRESLLIAGTMRSNGDAHTGFEFADGLVTHSLRAEGFDASEDGTGRGTPLVAVDYRNGSLGEIAGTLEAAQSKGNRGQGVLAYRTSPNCGAWETGDRVDALTTGTDPSAHILAFDTTQITSAGSSRSYVAAHGVRRLTPRECERLQGFPDDWTRYLDTGKEQADGPRYKQLGNAVTVNVAEWIGRRIVANVPELAAWGRGERRVA